MRTLRLPATLAVVVVAGTAALSCRDEECGAVCAPADRYDDGGLIPDDARVPESACPDCPEHGMCPAGCALLA